jgi:hypothetical protein
MDLDSFVSEQNLALYRRLLSTALDDEQRRTIFDLLADETAKLRIRTINRRSPPASTE